MNTDLLRKEQRVALELKLLYLTYGYREYKLSGFEEYSLYAENQSFLTGKEVITFNAGGKLMALRPDVTLSVVKNINPEGVTEKLFYEEKVYRKQGGRFSELNQIGVEVIGSVDIAAEAEITRLMLKTLEATGGNYVLDVSHIGIIVSMLDGMGLEGKDRAFALDCLNRKAEHDFLRFAKQSGIDEKSSNAFAALMKLPVQPKCALKELKKLSAPNTERFLSEMQLLISLVDSERLNVNFTADGDADYYNGLIFKGYVEGVPCAVLSGGRYDKLLTKFGKDAQAIGFALYMGELSGLFDELPFSPEAAVVYTQKSVKNALKISENMRKSGLKTLMTQTVPDAFRGEIIYAEDDND